MAKKKTEKVETTEDVAKIEQPSIWDQILESVNDQNKDDSIKGLESAVKFLEETGGDPEIILGIKSTIKKIK